MGVIICDNGTGFMKIGELGSAEILTVPSIVGRPMLKSMAAAGVVPQVGQDALDKASFLDLTFPMENGMIRDEAAMIALYTHCFSLLSKPDIQNESLVITESAINPIKNKEKMARIFFDHFKVERLYIGVTTGLVVEIGEGVTSVVPVFDGYVLPHLVKRLDVAGRDISKQLAKSLFQKGVAPGSLTADAVRKVKEALCYVAVDLALEERLAKETTALMEPFSLSDNKQFMIGEERFMAPEILFSPHLIGHETCGIAELVFDVIQQADIDLRPRLYSKIILSGGSSKFPGLAARLQRELESLYTSRILKGSTEARTATIQINVVAPVDRQNLVYDGAYVASEILENKPDIWITRKEWESTGVAALEKSSLQG